MDHNQNNSSDGAIQSLFISVTDSIFNNFSSFIFIFIL